MHRLNKANKMKKVLLCCFLLCSWLFINQAQAQHFDFSESKLSNEWQYIRKPDKSKYKLRDNVLRLYGDIYEITEGKPTTFIGLPQNTPRFKAETHITLFDDENGDEAGMTFYMSDSCYVQAFLNNNRGEHRVKLCFQLLNHRWLMAEKHMLHLLKEIWLRIEGDETTVKFYYSLDGEKYVSLDSIERRLLSPELSGSTTPPMVGLYCLTGTTKYQTGYSYADFDYFDYKAQ